MGVIWHKVWSDLWHHKIRTLLAVLSIAAGVFAVGAIFGEADQLLAGMDRAHQAVLPSHINLTLQDRIDRDTAIRLKNIEGVVDVEVLNQVSTRYKLHPQDEWEPAVLVMRADFEDQTYDLLQLKAGEWPKKDNIGIDRSASVHYGIDIGDKVIFELDKTDRALTISGKIRHPFVPPPSFGGEPRFFMDAQGLERFNIPDGEFNQLLVRVEPYSPEFAREIASEIKDNREEYIGPWLPEPLRTDEAAVTPVDKYEMISMAALVLLENLSPLERAVFLLRGVFDYNYAEIARIVEKSEANCRQSYHRARQYLHQHRPRFKSSPAAQQKLVTGFLQAIQTGDVDALTTLLAKDVTLWSDGGGKAIAARHPVVGKDRIARLLLVSYRKRPNNSDIELAEVNGVLSILYRVENQVVGVMSFDGNDAGITDIWAVWNPDKLQHLHLHHPRE